MKLLQMLKKSKDYYQSCSFFAKKKKMIIVKSLHTCTFVLTIKKYRCIIYYIKL